MPARTVGAILQWLSLQRCLAICVQVSIQAKGDSPEQTKGKAGAMLGVVTSIAMPDAAQCISVLVCSLLLKALSKAWRSEVCILVALFRFK